MPTAHSKPSSQKQRRKQKGGSIASDAVTNLVPAGAFQRMDAASGNSFPHMQGGGKSFVELLSGAPKGRFTVMHSQVLNGGAASPPLQLPTGSPFPQDGTYQGNTLLDMSTHEPAMDYATHMPIKDGTSFMLGGKRKKAAPHKKRSASPAASKKKKKAAAAAAAPKKKSKKQAVPPSLKSLLAQLRKFFKSTK